MAAKTMVAGFPDFAEASPLARRLCRAWRWLLRRVSPAAGVAERVLAVEERVVIGPKKMLVLVRCRNQRFLVATAGDSVGPIVEIAAAGGVRRSRKERGA